MEPFVTDNLLDLSVHLLSMWLQMDELVVLKCRFFKLFRYNQETIATEKTVCYS